MKILMFCRFYSPHIGGVEKHTQKISKIFLKRGFEITLITEKFGKKLPETEIIDGVRVFRVTLLERINFLNKFIVWFWLLKNISLINESDIIHCHDIFFWYLPFRFLFPKKPVYTTFHGWEGKFPIPKRYVLARKIWEKLSFGNICVGDYINKWYGITPKFVTYGGVDLYNNCCTVHSSGSKKIAFIGRLEREKGLLKFIDLVKSLNKRKIKLLIKFYGDGTLRKIAERFGNLCGPVYSIKDINCQFIFTSGFLSSLEAMVYKKLIMTIYENGIEKDIFENSLFCDKILIEADPKNLSDKILYYLDHPEEEKKLVEKGYEWAKTQTWEKVADLYLKLWGIKA